jgi:hypothetical protein
MHEVHFTVCQWSWWSTKRSYSKQRATIPDFISCRLVLCMHVTFFPTIKHDYSWVHNPAPEKMLLKLVTYVSEYNAHFFYQEPDRALQTRTLNLDTCFTTSRMQSAPMILVDIWREISITNKQTNKLRGFSPQANYSDLCGLVVRVPGYRSRGPGFDFRRYQIFWEVVGLKRGSLSLVRLTEELLERKVEAPV